jgi:hypothetical protein
MGFRPAAAASLGTGEECRLTLRIDRAEIEALRHALTRMFAHAHTKPDELVL